MFLFLLDALLAPALEEDDAGKRYLEKSLKDMLPRL